MLSSQNSVIEVTDFVMTSKHQLTLPVGYRAVLSRMCTMTAKAAAFIWLAVQVTRDNL
jgi:hypothetical protein